MSCSTHRFMVIHETLKVDVLNFSIILSFVRARFFREKRGQLKKNVLREVIHDYERRICVGETSHLHKKLLGVQYKSHISYISHALDAF